MYALCQATELATSLGPSGPPVLERQEGSSPDTPRGTSLQNVKRVVWAFVRAARGHGHSLSLYWYLMTTGR